MKQYDFLHLKVHHTNKEFPISLSLDANNYPEQMDIVGTTQEITFRRKDLDETDYLYDEDVDVHRPEDDSDTVDQPESQEHYLKSYTETKNFTILRADNEDTYKLVAISEDFQDVLVSDSRHYTETAYNLIGGQKIDWLGTPVHARYIKSFDDELAKYTDSIPMDNFQDADWLESYILSCDESEPSNSVIIQYISDTEFRVILDSEALLQIDSELTDDEYIIASLAIILYNNTNTSDNSSTTDTTETSNVPYGGYERNRYIQRIHQKILKGRTPYAQ